MKTEIIKVIKLLLDKEGVNTIDILAKIGKSEPTIKRYLKILKKLGFIEYKGARKAGGYYITEKMKAKLK